MDRPQLLQLLRDVEGRIAEDEINVIRQREILELLSQGHRDIAEAARLLDAVESVRQQHCEQRKRLLMELGD
jgi:hypothetical protein